MTTTNAGIEYTLPTAHLLQHSGLGTSEYAGRTAYDSFDKSENTNVKHINALLHHSIPIVSANINDLNSIEHSDLLDQLAWVHHHHSVLEHCNLTYLIKGVSRGVLQELVRHRIASYTVRSTRYTMQGILNAFIASYNHPRERYVFKALVPNFSIFNKESEWFTYECEYIFSKLKRQLQILGYAEFLQIALSKNAREQLEISNTAPEDVFSLLQAAKQKRNVGDAFKHIVTDNWYTDVVMTMNLRSLKNFFELRDSGAAYFLIRELAKQMKLATPSKYLKLICKDMRDKS
jgi:thymidylate synthase (FAD)